MAKNCERCEELTALDRLDVDASIDFQLSMEVGNLVPDQVRDERLKICSSCPFFLNGTCQKCGCYTRFRASLQNKACPIDRWPAIKI